MKNNIPLYQRIIKDIKDNISKGVYRADDKLPTEEEFCIRYNTSRTTVRRALLDLEHKHIIISRQGSGNFISPRLFTQSLQRFYSFSKEMRKLNKVPSNKVLSFETVDPPQNISEIMKLEKGEKVIQLIRLRLADNEPYMYSTNYLPLQPFIGLSESMLKHNDLYTILQDRYKVIFNRATESFNATNCPEYIASHIGISTQLPCILLKRITYSLDRIIEYTESYVRGDTFEFTIDLDN